MQRITTGSDTVVVSPAFVDPTGTEGVPADDVAVVITRTDGTTIDGLTPAAVDDQDGVYAVTIPAGDLADVDVLQLAWSGTVDGAVQAHTGYAEVVGGRYLTLYAMRDLPDIKPKHTDEQLLDILDEFEDLAETYTGRAWVPRYGIYTAPLWHDPIQLARLPRTILSAAQAGHTIDTTHWELRPSGLVRTHQFASHTPRRGSLIIRYCHGADYPPAQLVGACREYVQGKALERGNRVGRDTLSVADGGGGTTRYSTPDWDAGRPTGMFDVDRVLNGLGRDQWHVR